MSRIRHLDLFSGIGGFALAVRWLGHETVGFCEIDEWSRRVLDKHWPEVPKHDDIRTLKGTEFGPIDLVTGGFPCQPFSVAGNQRGAADDRHLWPEMARLIAKCRPRYVLGENVVGIIKMELDNCVSDLEAIGYTARALVIPAIGTDARHIRQRVWIMAHDDRHRFDDERDGKKGAEWSPLDATQPSCQQRQDSPQQLDRTAISTGWHESNTLANSNDKRELQPKRDIGDKRRWFGDGGSTDGRSWPVEPRVGRVAYGVPGRVDRLRGLGNAIVPQLAYEILREMIGEAA